MTLTYTTYPDYIGYTPPGSHRLKRHESLLIEQGCSEEVRRHPFSDRILATFSPLSVFAGDYDATLTLHYVSAMQRRGLPSSGINGLLESSRAFSDYMHERYS